MRRQTALLSALGVVLVLVLFYFFVFQPKNDELAAVREEIDTAVAQQATLEGRIAALQEVRLRAPEIEAALAAAESVIPREAALPSALRQLQLAADDSGVDLMSVSPGRPEVVVGDIPELTTISLSLSVEGSYFQVVDFLRRIEDPAITPRGIEWNTGSVSPADYPRLAVSLGGEMYALLAVPPAPEPETPVATEPPPAETPAPAETEPAA